MGHFKKKKERKKGHPENTHIPQASEAEVLLKTLLHDTCNELSQQWCSEANLGVLPLSNPHSPALVSQRSVEQCWLCVDGSWQPGICYR